MCLGHMVGTTPLESPKGAIDLPTLLATVVFLPPLAVPCRGSRIPELDQYAMIVVVVVVVC